MTGSGRSLALFLVSAMLAGCASTTTPSTPSAGSPEPATNGSVQPSVRVTPTASASEAAVVPAILTYFSAGQPVTPWPAGRPEPTVARVATGIESSEPTIAILPDGTFAFQGWDRPATGHVGITHVFVGRPPDGAWTDVSASPAAPTHDPYLAADPQTGRIFSANLLVPGELEPDLFCIVLAFSDDQGDTWTPVDPVCDADADRPRVITSTPVTSRTDGYPNIVTLCYFHSRADGQSCQRSLDGGRTFDPSGGLPPDGCDPGLAGALFGHLATDPSGVLYLARMSCRRPVIAISHDEGVTWEQHDMGPEGWNGYPETAVAVDDDGVVFGLWVAGDRLPYLASSADGGVTWSEPIRVSAPDVTEVNLPVLEAGAGGRLAIGMLVSLDAPTRAKPSVAVQCSAVLNDPVEPVVRGACGPGRCKSNADFLDMAIDAAGSPWLAFVSCPDGRCPTTTMRGFWGSAQGMLGSLQGIPLR